jgi:hypothetical protein
VSSIAPLRRFAVLGDLHAEDARLERVLTWLSGQQVEALLSVGDIVDGAGSLDRCCELLAAHAAVDLGRGEVEFFEVFAEPGCGVVVEPAEVVALPG